MSEIVGDAKNTNIELTDASGVTLSGTNSRVKHTGSGTFTIDSGIGGITIGTTSDVTIANDLILDNDNSSTQYINLNYNATAANRWRIYVDSSGLLNFERFNGTSCVNKFQLT
jgi:hypothetical protein